MKECFSQIASKSKPFRCEGKVDWSCSVLRAKPWQESPHSSKLARGLTGGKVGDVYDYILWDIYWGYLYIVRKSTVKMLFSLFCSPVKASARKSSRYHLKVRLTGLFEGYLRCLEFGCDSWGRKWTVEDVDMESLTTDRWEKAGWSCSVVRVERKARKLNFSALSHQEEL